MLGTAHVHAADTLHAEVKVLRQIGDRYEVEVVTGVGGWATPGKTFFANASIVEFAATESAEASAVEEPAPPAEQITGDQYVTLLLARQAAWVARNGARLRFPPLLEWFIRDGDERWVQLPETAPAPKRERKPRVCRSAASLREERDRVQVKIDAIAGIGSDDDNAIVNLSPYSRSKAAASAGQRRFAQMDRDLVRFADLHKQLANLNSRIATAEAREERQAS